MAKRRTKTPRSRSGGGSRKSTGAGGRAGGWLAAALFLAAGGAGAWFWLGGEEAAPPRTPAPAGAVSAAKGERVAAAPKPASSGAGAKAPTGSGHAVVKFEAPDVYPRSPTSWLEAQVALSRRGYSCGSIDGVGGAQTVAAWRAFQAQEGLAETSWLDGNTCAALPLEAAPTTTYTVAAADLARLQPVSPTWLGKSEQTALDYETLLELVGERFRAHPTLLKKLNPAFDWDRPVAGARLVVPAAARTAPRAKAAALHVQLAAHTLQAYDDAGRMIAHFPVSIAKKAEKRPVGELHVTVVIADPNYTFDPDVFPESAEGRELGRRLVVPPGPNNPVGVAWVGLDRSGYGIHGTPNPEQVGRTESHGCFRLANWDARTLLDLAWVGLPVYVDP